MVIQPTPGRPTRTEFPRLKLRQLKLPSVVGMSAWGASELEVLAPLGRYRKTDEFEALRGRTADGVYRKEDINEDYDRVRVIQLEYLGP